MEETLEQPKQNSFIKHMLFWIKNNIDFLLLCILTFLSFFGGFFLGVKTPIGTMSFYRIFGIICFGYFVYYFIKRKGKIKWHPAIIFMLIWVAYSAIQLIFAVDKAAGIKYFLVLGLAAFYFLFAYNVCDTHNKFKILLYICHTAFIIYAFMAFREIFFGKYFGEIPYIQEVYYSNKAISNIFHLHIPTLLGNENNLALFMIFGIFSALFLLTTTKYLPTKIVTGISVLAFFFIIICTTSRAAIYSCLLYSLIAFFMYLSKKVFMFIAKFILPVLMAAVIVFVIIYITKLAPMMGDATRANLLYNSVDILFEKSYGFGVGLGQVEPHMYWYTNTNSINNAHNIFAEVLCSSGVIIFTIIIYFSIVFIIKLNKLNIELDASSKCKDILAATIGFLLTFILASVGPSTFFTDDYFWIIFFLIIIFFDKFYEQFSIETIKEEKEQELIEQSKPKKKAFFWQKGEKNE